MINLRQILDDNLQENILLAPYTTFRIGGPAKYFFVARTSEDIVKAVKAAEVSGIEYFILGGGSNLLISDAGFDGLVIKTTNDKIDIDGTVVEAEAGVIAAFLINKLARVGLTGLEFMAGIPGTVGGMVFGNAGAFGRGFGDMVIEVEVYQNGQIRKLAQEQMNYSYRHSVLKEKPGVVLSVKIKLEKKEPTECQKKVDEIIKSRIEKLPAQPSAGSIFKNIDLKETKIDKKRVLKELDVTETEFLEAAKHGKLPVGYILDKLDLKGKTIGQAQISEKHGGIIVNLGGARAEQVMMLISDIKMRVRNQLGIQLQEEIGYLGF